VAGLRRTAIKANNVARIARMFGMKTIKTQAQ